MQNVFLNNAIFLLKFFEDVINKFFAKDTSVFEVTPLRGNYGILGNKHKLW